MPVWDRGIICNGQTLGDDMKRFWALGFLFVFALGCATEADQAQWNEAMKDLRGDNMKMRTGNWGKVDNDVDTMPSLKNSSQNRSGMN
jgi:hypothetical protein